MLVGLNLPNYGPLGTRDAVTAIAERAEALGYTSLWTSDHVLLPPTSEPEPFGTCSKASPRSPGSPPTPVSYTHLTLPTILLV